MNAFPVVIDNDSLCHLVSIDTELPVINCLKFIFTAVHIPDEILVEFEKNCYKNPERQRIILEVNNSNRFFRKCSSFDLIDKAFLQTYKNIDSGEAAATAQYNKIQARFIISEDRKFTKKITEIYPAIRIIKLKHVFAMLDLQNLVNWTKCISILHQKRAFTSSELREAYSYVCQYYGKNISKELLSQKSSLKSLGIT